MSRLRSAAPILAGLLALYMPTYLNLYRLFWRTRDGSYGAVMFVLIGWLIWRERAVFREPCATAYGGPAIVLVVVGLLAYVVGKSQFFYQLEVGSQLPLAIGIVALFLGKRGLKRLSFPVMLLLFVIPVPGSLADQLLLPLKELVSLIVDDTLHLAGYPIARNGVVLMIGPYSLLIADACSGLNSMVALSGIGLIYVYLAIRANRWFNTALLLSILPIAFAANILRVLTLVLITYYCGEEPGTAFHEQAGYLEIAVAFGAFFGLDRTFNRIFQRRAPLNSPDVRASARR